MKDRDIWSAVKKGTLIGLRTAWELGKVIVPVYIVVTVLKYTAVLTILANWFQPAMRLVGLPGKAAIALIAGYVINLYAAVGAVAPLNLKPEEVTVIGLMVVICHSVPIEGAVLKKMGASAGRITSVRLLVSFFAGFLVSLFSGRF